MKSRESRKYYNTINFDACNIVLYFQQGYRTASDIWSLGITAIEMGERQPPYAETHPSRVMVAIPARPPPEFLNPDAWSKSIKVGVCGGYYHQGRGVWG